MADITTLFKFITTLTPFLTVDPIRRKIFTEFLNLRDSVVYEWRAPTGSGEGIGFDIIRSRAKKDSQKTNDFMNSKNILKANIPSRAADIEKIWRAVNSLLFDVMWSHMVYFDKDMPNPDTKEMLKTMWHVDGADAIEEEFKKIERELDFLLFPSFRKWINILRNK